MKFTFAVAVACLLLAAMPAAGLAQAKPDTQISDDVIRSVNTYTRFTVFDYVGVDVQNGVLTLTGRVTMPFKKDEIAQRAAGVDGVRTCPQRHRRAAALAVRRGPASQGGARHLRQRRLLAIRGHAQPSNPHRRRGRPSHSDWCGAERGGSHACALARNRPGGNLIDERAQN